MWYETRVPTFAAWLNTNWFTLLQSVGIISSLFFTAIAVGRDKAARKRSDLLALTERHQDIWSELHRRPELGRVLEKNPDLLAKPITREEEEYLRIVFVHFYTGYLLAKSGSLMPVGVLAADIRDFFSYPLPRAVWKENAGGLDPKFVAFVNKSLRSQTDKAAAS